MIYLQINIRMTKNKHHCYRHKTTAKSGYCLSAMLFYTLHNIALKCCIFLRKNFYHTKFQDMRFCGRSSSPTLEVRTSAMLMLLMIGIYSYKPETASSDMIVHFTKIMLC
jgi:hypothetical protein